MKNLAIRSLVLFFLVSVHLSTFAQKEKSTVKKFHLLPIFLQFNAEDSAFNSLVREAFTRHKVKLIGKKEFDQLNEGEAYRLVTKYRSQNFKYSSESELREEVSKDQRFVANMLIATFSKEAVGDSIIISSVSWSNTPTPTNVHSSRTSGDIKTDLKDRTISFREQVYALVDEILTSKWVR